MASSVTTLSSTPKLFVTPVLEVVRVQAKLPGLETVEPLSKEGASG